LEESEYAQPKGLVVKKHTHINDVKCNDKEIKRYLYKNGFFDKLSEK